MPRTFQVKSNPRLEEMINEITVHFGYLNAQEAIRESIRKMHAELNKQGRPVKKPPKEIKPEPKTPEEYVALIPGATLIKKNGTLYSSVTTGAITTDKALPMEFQPPL